MIPAEDTNTLPPEWADVEERVKAHPECWPLLLDVLDKVVTARAKGWTGWVKVDVNRGSAVPKSRLEAA